jgi:hypothetical protein
MTATSNPNTPTATAQQEQQQATTNAPAHSHPAAPGETTTIEIWHDRHDHRWHWEVQDLIRMNMITSKTRWTRAYGSARTEARATQAAERAAHKYLAQETFNEQRRSYRVPPTPPVFDEYPAWPVWPLVVFAALAALLILLAAGGMTP